MKNNGGKITYRTTNSDVDEPYEINISLFDAMRETFSKEKKLPGGLWTLEEKQWK